MSNILNLAVALIVSTGPYALLHHHAFVNLFFPQTILLGFYIGACLATTIDAILQYSLMKRINNSLNQGPLSDAKQVCLKRYNTFMWLQVSWSSIFYVIGCFIVGYVNPLPLEYLMVISCVLIGLPVGYITVITLHIIKMNNGWTFPSSFVPYVYLLMSLPLLTTHSTEQIYQSMATLFTPITIISIIITYFILYEGKWETKDVENSTQVVPTLVIANASKRKYTNMVRDVASGIYLSAFLYTTLEYPSMPGVGRDYLLIMYSSAIVSTILTYYLKQPMFFYVGGLILAVVLLIIQPTPLSVCLMLGFLYAPVTAFVYSGSLFMSYYVGLLVVLLLYFLGDPTNWHQQMIILVSLSGLSVLVEFGFLIVSSQL